MQIIKGKWTDDDGSSVDNFNVSKLLKIAEKVQVLYGENISYARINLVCSIDKLSVKEENSLSHLLEQEGMLTKLTGY